MINEATIKMASVKHRIEPALIKAVAEVEGSGKGFLNTGEPVILFEPHVFYRQLMAHKINPIPYLMKNGDVLYKKWGTHPYGPSTSQHARLQKAINIGLNTAQANGFKEAALESASWGMFQIMGFNWKLCGCESLQEFINKMYDSVDSHLECFMSFIDLTGAIDYLRSHDWEAFAEHYNGPEYKKNNYDYKLR